MAWACATQTLVAAIGAGATESSQAQVALALEGDAHAGRSARGEQLGVVA